MIPTCRPRRRLWTRRVCLPGVALALLTLAWGVAADTDLTAPHTATGPKGQTPLMEAAQRADLATIESLLAAGVQINVRNKTGGTALMYGALSGDAKTVRLLLERGAEVNAAASNGWTALMIAAVKGYDAVAGLLLAAGADVNKPDVYGWTPLMRAIYEGRTSAARTLLTAPALDATRRNEHGATALHYAADRGDLQSAQSLLQRGADADAKDVDGNTPQALAARNQHAALVALFQQHRR